MLETSAPAPAVDRLIVVADDRDVSAFVRQQRDQLQLQFIRVLELIDHEVAKPVSPAIAHVRMLAQQSHRERKQIVEVDGVQSFQLSLVAREDSAEKRVFIFRRFPAVVLRFADRFLARLGSSFSSRAEVRVMIFRISPS